MSVESRPNVVFILVDNTGWGDLSVRESGAAGVELEGRMSHDHWSTPLKRRC